MLWTNSYTLINTYIPRINHLSLPIYKPSLLFYYSGLFTTFLHSSYRIDHPFIIQSASNKWQSNLCRFNCYLVHVISDLSQPLLHLFHVLALLLKLKNTTTQHKARRVRGGACYWMFITIKDIIWDILTLCQRQKWLHRMSLVLLQ